VHAGRPPQIRTSSKLFVDVVPGVRVVPAVDFVSDDPTHAGTTTTTWEVTAVEAGTRIDIRADAVPPASPRRSRCRTRLFTRQPRHLPRAVTEAGTTEVQASACAAGLSVVEEGCHATPPRPARSAIKRKGEWSNVTGS